MIHKFRFEDSNILMDIHSGSIHIIDDVAYAIVEDVLAMSNEDVVAKYEADYAKEEIEEAIKELKTLQVEGMLDTEDSYKDLVPAFLDREPVVKALCLHVAHDCNLKCKYCFAGEGEYHGDRGMMTLEVGKAAIDFLAKNSAHRKNIEVDFFGGEPLMNFEVVKGVVEYARSIEAQTGKNFRFTMTTNGVLLSDEIIDYCHEQISKLARSSDGRPDAKHHTRPTPNGKGSYDVIMPKFKKLVEKRGGKQYYIRGTFTHHNTDFASDVLHMADQGFDEVSVEPVVAPADMDYALQEGDMEMICSEYERLAKEMLRRHKEEGKCFNFFHFMVDLTGGPCVHKRLAGCGSGSEYLAATPTGELYPCHQFVGMPEFKMGDVWEGVVNHEQRKKFEKCNVYSKQECTECWAKFFCSGGCAANSYNFNGDINSTYEIGCNMQKKRLECAIGLKAELSE
ncbi:MAG: thioether cross-link-forming SCIFF peptide maturase [Niameybacter sp.]